MFNFWGVFFTLIALVFVGAIIQIEFDNSFGWLIPIFYLIGVYHYIARVIEPRRKAEKELIEKNISATVVLQRIVFKNEAYNRKNLVSSRDKAFRDMDKFVDIYEEKSDDIRQKLILSQRLENLYREIKSSMSRIKSEYEIMVQYHVSYNEIVTYAMSKSDAQDPDVAEEIGDKKQLLAIMESDHQRLNKELIEILPKMQGSIRRALDEFFSKGLIPREAFDEICIAFYGKAGLDEKQRDAQIEKGKRRADVIVLSRPNKGS